MRKSFTVFCFWAKLTNTVKAIQLPIHFDNFYTSKKVISKLNDLFLSNLIRKNWR